MGVKRALRSTNVFSMFNHKCKRQKVTFSFKTQLFPHLLRTTVRTTLCHFRVETIWESNCSASKLAWRKMSGFSWTWIVPSVVCKTERWTAKDKLWNFAWEALSHFMQAMVTLLPEEVCMVCKIFMRVFYLTYKISHGWFQWYRCIRALLNQYFK